MTPRKRWEFATMAVLDKIRRDSWSPFYLLQRIKDGKTYVELSIRANNYGKDLNDDEKKEYSRLFSTLLAGDSRFYASLIAIQLAAVPIYSYVDHEPRSQNPRSPTHKYLQYSRLGCDVCGSYLGGSRVLCMDCLDKSTVDFCSEPECLNSTIVPGQNQHLSVPHTPDHSMLKVHRILFNRDIGRVEKNAKRAF